MTVNAQPGKEGDRRLRRLSAWLSHGALALAAVLPLAVGWNWLDAPPERLLSEAGLGPAAQLADWQRLAGGMLAVLPSLLLSAGLLAARRCFRLFSRGLYLSGAAVCALRAFGLRVALSGLAGLSVPTLLALLLSVGQPAGSRALTIHLGSEPALGLLLGGAVWAIAAVMARAVAIADEHAQFV